MTADRSPGEKTPREKADTAFKTISEVAELLGLPQHILRYWETRFPQLKPLQRAGNRRYYRPADVALAQRLDRLLNHEGYTVRGVQKLLAEDDRAVDAPAASDRLSALKSVRDGLKLALIEDARLSL